MGWVKEVLLNSFAVHGILLYQGGPVEQFRGGCKMTRAFSFIISVAALLFFFLDEMITLLPGNMALQCAFTRIDWMPVLLRSVCPGVYRTPAITIIKEIRPNRFRLTDYNLRRRHPLNRFRFSCPSIISNQDIQMIRNAVWFLLARADLPVII